MDKITKIQVTNDKPEVEQCIIHGKMNYVNYIYDDAHYAYIVIFSPEKLSLKEMIDIIDDDENLYKYF